VTKTLTLSVKRIAAVAVKLAHSVDKTKGEVRLKITTSAAVSGYKKAGRKVAILVNGTKKSVGLTDAKGRLVLRLGPGHKPVLKNGENSIVVVVYPGSSRYRPAFSESMSITVTRGKIVSMEAQK
jgi:hypothetical protein